jgi:spore maturation protein CgeB
MKLVVFGLSVSSSWGNGHATLWRGLVRALGARSHHVVFFERDVEYYRYHRDLTTLEHGELVIYDSFDAVLGRAARELQDADAAIVTSFCPDGRLASDLVLERTRGTTVFYDLDTPVTLAALERGALPPYLPAQGLSGFDLVLSFTGGEALELLRTRLGATRVAPFYGQVDPDVHRPATPEDRFRCALSYVGTYSEDRHAAVRELFLAPAATCDNERFLLAGSQYPEECFPPNVTRIDHVAPTEHASLYCSSRITLNVTRSTMARFGYCPSGRLFEAAACGAVLATDWFEGLDAFFRPDSEVFVVRERADVLALLASSTRELARRAEAARERALTCHTASARALELERLFWSSPTSTRIGTETISRE